MSHDKAELYNLVAEMRGYRCEVPFIADQLRVSIRRVQQVLADMRGKPPAFDDLPALLRERITYFAKRNDSQAETVTRA